MDYLRKTIDSDELLQIFDLPSALRGRKVDVIILPVETVESEPPVPKKSGSAYGALHKYANPDLIPLEKGAWERAAVEKYIRNQENADADD